MRASLSATSILTASNRISTATSESTSNWRGRTAGESRIKTYDSAPYMVRELLEEETLRERLRGGVLSSKKAIKKAIELDTHTLMMQVTAERTGGDKIRLYKGFLPQQASMAARFRLC